jgi:hypothetical protein
MTIPQNATDLECFAIKNGEAYIGYKIPNGDFHFIQIPYTEPPPNTTYSIPLKIMYDVVMNKLNPLQIEK